MATSLNLPKFEYFNVTMPAEYVVHVEINRPSKLNAWIEPMWPELRFIFRTLSTSPEVRAILLSGAGSKAFTSGLDTGHAFTSGPLVSSPGLDPSRKAQFLRRYIDDFQSCVTAVEACEKPVVCVMHGYAYGMGIDLSTACDVRFASKDTKFCVKEIDLGLAADVGTLSRLPKVVGMESWVKDVCYTARVWGPEEAQRVGYISRICENKEDTVKQALDWCVYVAAKSPVGVQSTKQVLNYSRDHTVAEGLHYVGVWNAAALQTGDVPESGRATVEKRKPRYEKL